MPPTPAAPTPRTMVTARIILCRAMPRWMTSVGSCSADMPVYISAPISRKAAGGVRGRAGEEGWGKQGEVEREQSGKGCRAGRAQWQNPAAAAAAAVMCRKNGPGRSPTVWSPTSAWSWLSQ